MEKSSQQTESTHLNGDLSVAEGEEARSSGSSELRNADEGQEKQSPFYEGVVGQPLPNEGEVNNFEFNAASLRHKDQQSAILHFWTHLYRCHLLPS